MEATKKKIPILRFPGFEEEWKSERFETLCSKISDGIHATPKYNDDGDFYFINGNNLVNGKISISDNTKRISETEANKHLRELNDRTILLSINGTIGNLAYYRNEKVVLGKSACYINLSEEVNKEFIYNILQNPQVQNFFHTELTGTTIKNLSLNTIKNTKLSHPSLPEQKKIASFLSAVDDKINNLNKKKELLESYKKGVMQKIFSQAIRFKSDDGGEFPDWEEKKLREIADCLDNQRVPLNESDRLKIKGNIPYWGANNIMDYINDYIFDETIVLLAEDGGYFEQYRTRPIAQLSRGKSWVNNHAHVLRGKKNLISCEFLYYSLVHKNILGYVNTGTRSKLNKSDMLRIRLFVPQVSEQTKITNFLSAIDQKIEQVNTQLEKTKSFKKGLLQQMFV